MKILKSKPRDNENAFFWKRSSVNRALKLWQQKNVFYCIYIYNHIKSSKNTPGGTLLCKSDTGFLQPQRVWFLRRFGLKTSIDFAHFGLELGMVFEETTGVYERIYRFSSKWIRKKEKYANSQFKKSILLAFLSK